MMYVDEDYEGLSKFADANLRKEAGLEKQAILPLIPLAIGLGFGAWSAKDAVKDFRNGNWKGGLVNTGLAAASLFTGGTAGAALRGGATAARAASAAGKLGRVGRMAQTAGNAVKGFAGRAAGAIGNTATGRAVANGMRTFGNTAVGRDMAAAGRWARGAAQRAGTGIRNGWQQANQWAGRTQAAINNTRVGRWAQANPKKFMAAQMAAPMLAGNPAAKTSWDPSQMRQMPGFRAPSFGPSPYMR